MSQSSPGESRHRDQETQHVAIDSSSAVNGEFERKGSIFEKKAHEVSSRSFRTGELHVVPPSGSGLVLHAHDIYTQQPVSRSNIDRQIPLRANGFAAPISPMHLEPPASQAPCVSLLLFVCLSRLFLLGLSISVVSVVAAAEPF